MFRLGAGQRSCWAGPWGKRGRSRGLRAETWRAAAELRPGRQGPAASWPDMSCGSPPWQPSAWREGVRRGDQERQLAALVGASSGRSPTRQEASLQPRKGSAVRRERSAVRKDPSAVRRLRSPTRRDVSPRPREGCAVRKDASAVRKYSSPVRKEHSPRASPSGLVRNRTARRPWAAVLVLKSYGLVRFSSIWHPEELSSAGAEVSAALRERSSVLKSNSLVRFCSTSVSEPFVPSAGDVSPVRFWGF